MPEPIRANEYRGIQLRTLLCVQDNAANLKLIERIVQRRPGMRLLTALNVESGLEAGFFRYLTKPLVLRKFTDALDSALAFADRMIAKANSAPQPSPYVR